MTEVSEAVIELPWEAEDPVPMRRQLRSRGSFCAHRKVVLNNLAHRVYCRDCNAEVDAFDFLTWLTGNWEAYDHPLKQAARSLAAKTAELEEVERQLRNAKARLRRISAHDVGAAGG